MSEPAAIRESKVGEPEPPACGFAWNRMSCATNPLLLGATLASGQAFRWRRDGQGVWWGAVNDQVFALWQPEGQPDAPLYWQTFPEPDQATDVRDYLRLDVILPELYTAWMGRDPDMADVVGAFRGLRVLRQPPQECFFAFQCATCNTVTKIERSVHHLAAHYGNPIETGLTDAPFRFFAFPTLDALASADEAILRQGLWGYRAPRVIANARRLSALPPNWLNGLRTVPYSEAHAALVELPGIGAKLADCIALFCLDKDAAVPVDTHVRQIAVRRFAPDLAEKSLTPRIYNALADAYRDRYGLWAGWAQQYLFFAELRRADLYAC